LRAPVEDRAMVDVAAAAERVIFLRMRFAAYQALLEELGDDAGARMAYNGEALELMSRSPPTRMRVAVKPFEGTARSAAARPSAERLP
jgi:hypothetical protein